MKKPVQHCHESTCKGATPGTLMDSLGRGLRLPNADVETCNEVITEVNVVVVEVIPAREIGSSP